MNPAADTARWRLTEHAQLRTRNTFQVDARARWLLEIGDIDALPEALAQVAGLPLLALGAGSNVLFAGDFDGAVLAFARPSADAGTRILEERPAEVLVAADAGLVFHDFVLWSLERGLAGLENLALIPGTVGAAPIQNIGAYGAEVGPCIHAVQAWDRQANALVELVREDCRFGYRDSVFKCQPQRYLVTRVTFRLARFDPSERGSAWRPNLGYAGLAEELAAMGVDAPTPREVAAAVIAIRRRKLPDPARLGNAGSFFKNPIVPAAQALALQASYPSLPAFAASDADSRKLSAAWLIEQAGWKGFREGDAGVSPQHALVLVNHGHASGAQLLALARRITASVRERFGVAIEPEPLLLGAHW
ncbi:MAG: UDP-N-acetylmuramate dehydrogenase [Pseudoxanthomonas sp.]